MNGSSREQSYTADPMRFFFCTGSPIATVAMKAGPVFSSPINIMILVEPFNLIGENIMNSKVSTKVDP